MCDKKVVKRLSEGEFWDHFCFMAKFLLESCQNKMTTQRLSEYLKFLTGLSYSVERLS